MRLSAVAIAASLVAVANAQSAYFPFPPEGPCVQACSDRVGKTRFPEYNDIDEYGPRFIESLSYTFESGSDKTREFMMEVGMCQGVCPSAENQLYSKQYADKRAWYNTNKNGTPPPRPGATTTTVTPTTTAPPTPTITTPPVIDPAFPFQPNGPCVAKCTNEAGKSLYSDYSEDPKSPYFWESMSYSYVPGSDKNQAFMVKAGTCMAVCPKPEIALYTGQYMAQVAWYKANKPTTTVPATTTTTTTTTTTAPPTTTTLPPGVDPAYPFLPNGPCVSNCINTVGKSMFPNFSEDPKSPYFFESLSYTFDRGSPKTREFMSAVGSCQGKCPLAENKLYSDQYLAQYEWYEANKPKTTTTGVPPVTTTATTTSGPIPTGPVNPPGGGFNYPFKPNGQCVSGCTNKVGKAMFPNYSEDPKSPYFIQSLAYTFESGSPNTGKFMTDAGICMGPCPKDERDLYIAQYPAQKAWYNANKNGGGVNPPATNTATTPATTTSGPVPTGPVNPPSGGFNYPFKPNGQCVSGCTNKVGKAMFPNYSEDPKSPYFIQSLAYTFESGSPNTGKFMTDAGICMSTCPKDEQDLYIGQYPAQKAWYNANKNGGGGGNNPTDPTTPVDPNNPTNPTNPTGPPTGPITPPTGGFIYPFEPNGPCVSGCTNQAGKAMFPNYSEDPKSPYFIQSLGYSFESGSPNTQKFMTDAGICMGQCPQPELDLYTQQFPLQKAWYLANKNSGVNATATPIVPTPTDSNVAPTGVPGGSNNENGSVKFAVSGLATLLTVISAVVISV
ncbi:hypothetical protein BGZ95_002622 [Linnemannia exigua]|uniref:Secreted protein n=1 Tax=Linnemannia exigua TaxID=604196 RepID=A0AAD4D583_9FUNG|nr:hypothetical protein BGZ95_002622 [Linnemannia exigua]